jgi:hypothetical protein
MEIKNRTGSKKPESMTSQLVLFVASSPREITALALPEYNAPKVLARASSGALFTGQPVLTGPSSTQTGGG